MKRARILIVSLAAACLLVLSACGPKELPQDSTTSTGTSSISGNTKEDSGEKPVQQDTVDKTETTPATPEQTIEDLSDTQKESVETPVSAAQEKLFTDCNETLYATTTVNVRDTYSTSGNKLGSLAKAQEITRTGIGIGDADGWSRVVFQGQEAYVSSDYLSATKPQVNTSTGSSGSSSGQTSKPSSKPSTGGSGGGNSQTTTSGSEIDKGSSNTSSGSSGLSGLAGAIQQDREDKGYSDAGGDKDKTSNQDYRDWVSGQVNVGG